MVDRETEEALGQLARAIKTAFVPNQKEIVAALRKLATFNPQMTPLQFTDPDCHPAYKASEIKKRADVRQELKEDAEAPFFSESYLYTLLGKEDARTLLARFHSLLRVLGVDERDVYVEDR